MPAYANIEAGYRDVSPMVGHLTVPVRNSTLPTGVFHGTLPGSNVPVYFIAERNLFNRRMFMAMATMLTVLPFQPRGTGTDAGAGLATGCRPCQ